MLCRSVRSFVGVHRTTKERRFRLLVSAFRSQQSHVIRWLTRRGWTRQDGVCPKNSLQLMDTIQNNRQSLHLVSVIISLTSRCHSICIDSIDAPCCSWFFLHNFNTRRNKETKAIMLKSDVLTHVLFHFILYWRCLISTRITHNEKPWLHSMRWPGDYNR